VSSRDLQKTNPLVGEGGEVSSKSGARRSCARLSANAHGTMSKAHGPRLKPHDPHW
jgi:hypothetical protein